MIIVEIDSDVHTKYQHHYKLLIDAKTIFKRRSIDAKCLWYFGEEHDEDRYDKSFQNICLRYPSILMTNKVPDGVDIDATIIYTERHPYDIDYYDIRVFSLSQLISKIDNIRNRRYSLT